MVLRHIFSRAKYPLSIVNHHVDVFPEDNQLFGFDIGCAFSQTVEHSALVGPKAAAKRMQFSVNAFHGWAHNRACQLRFHPLYRVGLGLEDLEGMERIFSASNAAAPVIRYASQFHWMQAVDLHFRQWDEDKYANLGRCLSSLSVIFI